MFDYLATNKPILALCDPEDVIAQLLNETKAGFTVDNADIDGIKKMILRCYSIWKNKEVLPRDWEKIKQYTRKNQCKILLKYLANNAERTLINFIHKKPVILPFCIRENNRLYTIKQ